MRPIIRRLLKSLFHQLSPQPRYLLPKLVRLLVGRE